MAKSSGETRTVGETIRIAVLGDRGIGKTALIVQLIAGRFIWNYDSSLEGVYKHYIAENDEDGSSVEIMDTANCRGTEEEVSARVEGYIKWADAFILVYSITDKKSFTEINRIKDCIHERKKRRACCTLVANKSDLEHFRQVSTQEGEKMASNWNCPFYELSACTSGSKVVRLPFQDVCRDVRRSTSSKRVRRRSSASQLFRKLIQKKLSI